MNVLQILNETTTSAIANGFDKKEDFSLEDGEKILISNLDRSTFDVGVLNIKIHKINIKAVRGDTHMGGEDFNSIIVSHFV